MIKRITNQLGRLFGVIGVLIGLAAAASAQDYGTENRLPDYDLSGEWVLHQSNWIDVTMDIKQNGYEITGNASYAAGRAGIMRGTVAGTAYTTVAKVGPWGTYINTYFKVEISWYKSTGVYEGQVIKSALSGKTWPKGGDPSNWVHWTVNRQFPARPQPGVPPNASGQTAAPKPVKNTGKVKVTPPAPLAPPYIIANPPLAKVEPFQMIGKTVLVWDAGPEHPYAELWVSVSGADETFVMEKGKGALEVTLQLGLRYKYILTDAGTKLATVELQAVP